MPKSRVSVVTRNAASRRAATSDVARNDGGDPDETALVDLLLDFASAPAPASAADAEAVGELFRRHPFVNPEEYVLVQYIEVHGTEHEAPLVERGSLSPSEALEQLAADHAVVRRILAKLVRGIRLGALLRDPLAAKVNELLGASRTTYAFNPRGQQRLKTHPILYDAPAAYWYATVLLVDGGQPYARRLARCSWEGRGCGRWFRRTVPRQRYCPSCRGEVARLGNAARQKNFRRKKRRRLRAEASREYHVLLASGLPADAALAHLRRRFPRRLIEEFA